MTDLWFVPQTGTKQDDQDTRKLIRRHVMLGKNRGRTQNPKQPAIESAVIFRPQDLKPSVQPFRSVVPRKVGSNLSFLEFADTVELSLMGETLQFCSATNDKLFLLEPCISFNATDSTASCLRSLACDALHLNVMVFSTQAYKDQVVSQITSELRESSCKASLQHYGKAICLLRERLADVETQQSKISDIIFMSVAALAMHALITGDNQNARNHVKGLRRLVGMKENGVYSFRSKTKQMIEILRCDISISLATGQAPLFFSESSQEPVFPLPELTASGNTPEQWNSILSSELAKIWDVLSRFCVMINEAAVCRRKLSEDILLETMASVMYRLSGMLVTPDSFDELIRLAMLSFCASAFLPWRQVRIPFGWLRHEYRRSIARVLQSHLARANPEIVLWFLTIYGTAFAPLPVEAYEEVQLWLMEVADLCELTSWDDVKKIVDGFLWIDIICDYPAQKLLDKTIAQRVAITDVLDMFN